MVAAVPSPSNPMIQKGRTYSLSFLYRSNVDLLIGESLEIGRAPKHTRISPTYFHVSFKATRTEFFRLSTSTSGWMEIDDVVLIDMDAPPEEVCETVDKVYANFQPGQTMQYWVRRELNVIMLKWYNR